MTRLSAQARAQVQAVGRRGTLTVDGRPVGLDVVVARTIGSRAVGLLGRRHLSHALLLTPCSSVHSLGMMIDLEVAYLDVGLRVMEVVALPRWRVHQNRSGAAAVLEAVSDGLTSRGVIAGARLGFLGAGLTSRGQV
jgi:uncharacterized protein